MTSGSPLLKEALELSSPKNDMGANRQEKEEITFQLTGPEGEHGLQLDMPVPSDFFEYAQTPLDWDSEDFVSDDIVTTDLQHRFAYGSNGLGFEADVLSTSMSSATCLPDINTPMDEQYLLPPQYLSPSKDSPVQQSTRPAHYLDTPRSQYLHTSRPSGVGLDISSDVQHLQPPQLLYPSKDSTVQQSTLPIQYHYRRHSAPTRAPRKGRSDISPYVQDSLPDLYPYTAPPPWPSTQLAQSKQIGNFYGTRYEGASAGLAVTKPEVVRTGTANAPGRRRTKEQPSFVCPVPGCRSVFTRSFNLKGHMRSHDQEMPFQCKEPSCGKKFLTQHDCRYHEEEAHPFRCKDCGEQLTSSTEEHHVEHGCTKQQDAKRESFLAEKRGQVTNSLGAIFKSVEHYRKLLSCNEKDAQKILDAFQMLLDTEAFQDRGQLIAAMRRLSERTQLYPTRFCLSGPAPTSEDEPVACGNFADIYKIPFWGEDTCYKVIRVYQRSQAEHIAKVYASEIIVWAQLSHLNILPFYGLIRYRSRIAFVSCWAINGDLEAYLAQNPNANRILICLDTAAGVEYLHSNDIVHGDLKGLNVLMDSSGRAALGDFGLSSVTDPQILKWASQSTMASKGGTTRWQAPELLGSEDTLGKVHNTKESDVFAWANICYEIFTQRLPFFEASYPATIVTIIMRGGTPTKPQDDDPAWCIHGLNDRIWDLMENCWSFNPSDRPDMTTVISRLGAENPIDSRPPGEWAEKAAMRFRNAQDGNISSRDLLPFWEDLEVLLSRVVSET